MNLKSNQPTILRFTPKRATNFEPINNILNDIATKFLTMRQQEDQLAVDINMDSVSDIELSITDKKENGNNQIPNQYGEESQPILSNTNSNMRPSDKTPETKIIDTNLFNEEKKENKQRPREENVNDKISKSVTTPETQTMVDEKNPSKENDRNDKKYSNENQEEFNNNPEENSNIKPLKNLDEKSTIDPKTNSNKETINKMEEKRENQKPLREENKMDETLSESVSPLNTIPLIAPAKSYAASPLDNPAVLEMLLNWILTKQAELNKNPQ